MKGSAARRIVEPPLNGVKPTKQVTIRAALLLCPHYGGTESDCRLLIKASNQKFLIQLSTTNISKIPFLRESIPTLLQPCHSDFELILPLRVRVIHDAHDHLLAYDRDGAGFDLH